MKYNYKVKIAIISYSSQCGLGFIRGINSYKYEQKKYFEKKPYLYTSSIIHGLFGILMYGNPIFLPFIIHKEMYRLEINSINLENEKKSRYYNELV